VGNWDLVSIIWLLFTFDDMCVLRNRYLGDDNFIRVAHALETCSILLREILRKRFNEQVRTIWDFCRSGRSMG
jgi:hypothetical protein